MFQNFGGIPNPLGTAKISHKNRDGDEQTLTLGIGSIIENLMRGPSKPAEAMSSNYNSHYQTMFSSSQQQDWIGNAASWQPSTGASNSNWAPSSNVQEQPASWSYTQPQSQTHWSVSAEKPTWAPPQHQSIPTSLPDNSTWLSQQQPFRQNPPPYSHHMERMERIPPSMPPQVHHMQHASYGTGGYSGSAWQPQQMSPQGQVPRYQAPVNNWQVPTTGPSVRASVITPRHTAPSTDQRPQIRVKDIHSLNQVNLNQITNSQNAHKKQTAARQTAAAASVNNNHLSPSNNLNDMAPSEGIWLRTGSNIRIPRPQQSLGRLSRPMMQPRTQGYPQVRHQLPPLVQDPHMRNTAVHAPPPPLRAPLPRHSPVSEPQVEEPQVEEPPDEPEDSKALLKQFLQKQQQTNTTITVCRAPSLSRAMPIVPKPPEQVKREAVFREDSRSSSPKINELLKNISGSSVGVSITRISSMEKSKPTPQQHPEPKYKIQVVRPLPSSSTISKPPTVDAPPTPDNPVLFQKDPTLPVNRFQSDMTPPVNNFQKDSTLSVTSSQKDSTLSVNNFSTNLPLSVNSVQKDISLPVNSYHKEGTLPVNNFQTSMTPSVTNGININKLEQLKQYIAVNKNLNNVRRMRGVPGAKRGRPRKGSSEIRVPIRREQYFFNQHALPVQEDFHREPDTRPGPKRYKSTILRIPISDTSTVVSNSEPIAPTSLENVTATNDSKAKTVTAEDFKMARKLRAFKNKTSHRCRRCEMVAATDQFFMNIATGEMQCRSCVKTSHMPKSNSAMVGELVERTKDLCNKLLSHSDDEATNYEPYPRHRKYNGAFARSTELKELRVVLKKLSDKEIKRKVSANAFRRKKRKYICTGDVQFQRDIKKAIQLSLKTAQSQSNDALQPVPLPEQPEPSETTPVETVADVHNTSLPAAETHPETQETEPMPLADPGV